jgi:hypothetical protein
MHIRAQAPAGYRPVSSLTAFRTYYEAQARKEFQIRHSHAASNVLLQPPTLVAGVPVRLGDDYWPAELWAIPNEIGAIPDAGCWHDNSGSATIANESRRSGKWSNKALDLHGAERPLHRNSDHE